jgi:heat shock protein HslJ
VPAAPLPPNPLWRVLSYQEAQRNLVPVLPGAELTATFRDDGAVTGTAGCNGYRGPYVMTGQQIKIGPLVSTRRACLEDALNRQEQAFLLALEAATGWSIAGERMTLLGANGTPVVVLIYAGPQPTPTP